MSEQRDYLSIIKNLREYITKLEKIGDMFDELPDVDDNSFDYYEYSLKLLSKEKDRVTKKLNKYERIINTYGNTN